MTGDGSSPVKEQRRLRMIVFMSDIWASAPLTGRINAVLINAEASTARRFG
jgi:hypothetical protein